MSFIFDDPQTILAKIREICAAKIADIADVSQISETSNFSNISIPVSIDINDQINVLIQRRTFLLEMKQACLNLRQCPDYESYSQETLLAEAQAIERLDKHIEDINQQLSVLLDLRRDSDRTP